MKLKNLIKSNINKKSINEITSKEDADLADVMMDLYNEYKEMI